MQQKFDFKEELLRTEFIQFKNTLQEALLLRVNLEYNEKQISRLIKISPFLHSLI